ncbi:hypothetical protein ACOMHN_063039 [Nucella lapillus]
MDLCRFLKNCTAYSVLAEAAPSSVGSRTTKVAAYLLSSPRSLMSSDRYRPARRAMEPTNTGSGAEPPLGGELSEAAPGMGFHIPYFMQSRLKKQYSPQQMLAAMSEVDAGKPVSKAARAHGVPLRSLYRKLKNRNAGILDSELMHPGLGPMEEEGGARPQYPTTTTSTTPPNHTIHSSEDVFDPAVCLEHYEQKRRDHAEAIQAAVDYVKQSGMPAYKVCNMFNLSKTTLYRHLAMARATDGTSPGGGGDLLGGSGFIGGEIGRGGGGGGGGGDVDS